MATNLELEQAHHQARRYLVSLVWHLTKQNPDYDEAFDKADKLCSSLTVCRIIEASIARQKVKADADLLAHVCTEGGNQS
jgi:hypothetical protein